jgi:hypothetical protein
MIAPSTKKSFRCLLHGRSSDFANSAPQVGSTVTRICTATTEPQPIAEFPGAWSCRAHLDYRYAGTDDEDTGTRPPLDAKHLTLMCGGSCSCS